MGSGWESLLFCPFCLCCCACELSRVQLFGSPWTGSCQAPLSMGFFSQEYWSGLSFRPLCWEGLGAGGEGDDGG